MSKCWYKKVVGQDYWELLWRANYERLYATSKQEEKTISMCKKSKLMPIYNKYLKTEYRIIEAGCGLGQWVMTLTEEGYDIEGVDNSVKTIALLNKNFPELRISFGDVRKLPYIDESFDIYLSHGVVEHFEEGPQEIIGEAYRILRKNGILFLTVPFMNMWRLVTRPFDTIVENSHRKKYNTYFYQYAFTRKEMISFLNQNGFRVIETFPWGVTLPLVDLIRRFFYKEKWPTTGMGVDYFSEINKKETLLRYLWINLRDTQLISELFSHMILFVAIRE